MPPPRDLFIDANRLRQHLLEWGAGERIVLLLHGFLEHAHVWDWVAPLLADAGLHVFALDWRGHGESQWIGSGGYYHFPDYTADLAFVRRALGGRAAIVGHSMGGGAAVQYAGTEPERLSALVSIEGLGLPDSDPASAPARFASWVGDLERAARRQPPAMTLEEAAQRLRRRFPRFSAEVAAHMARHGTRPEGGHRVWRFDPLHQTIAPQPYYLAQARAFWERVRCPVLYVEGSDSPLRLAEEDLQPRLAALRARRVTIAGAAHHPHLENPTALAQALIEFLDEAGA